MAVLSDIWFRSGLELIAIGEGIGLTDIRYDGEDYWDWIIGDFGSLQIDLTRTHTVPAEQTDTRLFLYPDSDEFEPQVAADLVTRLHKLGISPVLLGAWIHQKGHEFTKHILETRIGT